MPGVKLADRLFLTADSAETPQHVAALGIFSPPEGAGEDFVQQLVERFRGRQEFAPPFNYRLRHPRLKAVAPAWVELADDEVDLDFHFRHNALPRPGGQRELGQLVSRLHSRALDSSRPLWELHLIEGLDDGDFAMYFKVHHALMDGVGGVQRFTGMVKPDPEDPDPRPIWSVAPTRRRRASEGEEAGSNALVRARAAVPQAAAFGRNIASLGSVGAGMVRNAVRSSEADLATPFAAPRAVMNGRIGQQRRFATQTFAFERIRAVSKTAAVTINDVFLAICAGGLRRYLLELDALPEQSLIAGTPVNIRGAGDDASTNAFTLTVMKLRTDIADPLERIAAINRSSILAKEKLSRLDKMVVENQAALFMGPFITQQFTPLAGRTRPPYNVSISNVPGPVEPQYLAGARLKSLTAAAMLYHGVALFIAACTISGTFALGFTGDRDSLPHMQRIAVYTGEALDELETALAARK